MRAQSGGNGEITAKSSPNEQCIAKKAGLRTSHNQTEVCKVGPETTPSGFPALKEGGYSLRALVNKSMVVVRQR